MDVPKKKIVIKVKPHTVSVGAKKQPENGGKGVEAPVEPAQLVKKRRGLFSRCIEVVKDDIRTKIFRTKAVVQEPVGDWDAYLHFLELSKGKR